MYIAAEDVDYLIDDLAKPTMVLRFARAMMQTARAGQWVGAKKRADGARAEIIQVLKKHGFERSYD